MVRLLQSHGDIRSKHLFGDGMEADRLPFDWGVTAEVSIASRATDAPRADGQPADHSIAEVQTLECGNRGQQRARQCHGHERIAASRGPT